PGVMQTGSKILFKNFKNALKQQQQAREVIKQANMRDTCNFGDVGQSRARITLSAKDRHRRQNQLCLAQFPLSKPTQD
ncbi:hypothetical protein RA268_30290, partial [Pseudomonas syringae pv. tagetis]